MLKAKAFLWVLLGSLTVGAQPVIPGVPLPIVSEPKPVLESADQREARFLFEEGRRLHRQGEVGRAVQLYRKALARDPGRLEYRPYLGRALQALNQHGDALEQYSMFLAQEPDDPRVLRDRYWAWINLERWDDVERETKILDLTQSAQVDYLQLKGLAYLRRQRPEAALESLNQAHQQAPQRDDILLNLVSAHLFLKQSSRALELLDGQSRSGVPQWTLLRGLALYQLGRNQEAEAAWRSLATTPGLLESALNLASSLAERDQQAEALRVVAEALDREPSNQAAKLLYARLLNRAGRYDEAWMELRPLLEPDAYVGQRNYLNELTGWTLLGLQRNEEALRYLREAERGGVSGAALENNLALVLGRLGQTDEALQHQLEACRLAPEQASAWYHLGVLYELSARPQKALEAYEQFLKIAPQDPAVEGLKSHLVELRKFSR